MSRFVASARVVFFLAGCLLTIGSGKAVGAPQSVTIFACPSVPSTPVFPEPGSIVSSPVTFHWSMVAGAERYRLQVMDGAGSPVFDEVLEGQEWHLPLPQGPYIWQVFVIADGCEPIGFDPVPFEVVSGCPEEGPALHAPPQGSQQSSPVEFLWDPVDGAVEYRFVLHPANAPGFEAHLTSTTLVLDLPPGSYEWFVEALAPQCDPLSSGTFGFSIASVCPDAGPVPTKPEFGSVQTPPVEFRWNPVGGAQEYRLVLFKDEVPFQEHTATETGIDLVLPSGRYDWFVEAVSPSCPPIPSEFFFFTIAGGMCPEARAQLVDPPFLAEVPSPVQFSWSEVESTKEYRLNIAGPETEIHEIVLGTTKSIDLQSGVYEWFVEALPSGCPPIPSDPRLVRVTCSLGAPQLLSPEVGAVLEGAVEFSWSSVEDVDQYVLSIRLFDELFIEEPVHGTSAAFDLPPGEFHWSVRAEFPGCPPESSATRPFTIPGQSGCPSSGVALVSPENHARITTHPVTFEWGPVPGAFSYWLMLSINGEPFHIVAETGQPTVSLPLPPGRFAWNVVAHVERCDPVESEVLEFEVEVGQCEGTSLDLVSPEDQATVSPPVTFIWSEIPAAVEYVLFVRVEGGVPEPIGRTSEETALKIEWLPPGPVEWYVEAILPGCLIQSEHRFLAVPFDASCDRDRPFNLFPPDGATVPTNVVLEATGVVGAIAYQFWTSMDGETSSKLGSEQPQPRLEIDVPTGRVEWLVEAIFDGCASVKSEPSAFTVVSSSTECGITSRPELAGVGAAPSGGSYPVFWSPVPGAVSWEVQEDEFEQFPDPTSRTSEKLSMEFSHQVSKPTAWFYRVRGVDSCGQMGPYSLPVAVVVEPTDVSSSSNVLEFISHYGVQSELERSLFIPGSASSAVRILEEGGDGGRRRPVRRRDGSGTSFSASSDVSWISFTPESGSLPPEGKTIQVHVDPRRLPAGSNGGTITVSRSGSSGVSASDGGSNVSVTASLVTPVSSSPTSGSNPGAVILPLIVHSDTTRRSSSIAIANLASSVQKYELTFIPVGVDGTTGAKKTTVQLEPSQTMLLEQVVRKWFGATTGSTTEGFMEVRPLDVVSSPISIGRTMLASAVTFEDLAKGSSMSFVPPIPMSSFVGKSTSGGGIVIPAISQSTSISTVISLIEGAGDPATVSLEVYDSSNQLLVQQTVDLKGREQKQLKELLGTSVIEGGRAEIEVTSSKGKIFAYGRVVDGRSGHERILRGRGPSGVKECQYIPGAAESSGSSGKGTSTDLWMFNPSSSSINVDLDFIPVGNTTGKASASLTLGAGESQLLKGVLGTTFHTSGSSGMIVVDPNGSELLLNATYRKSGPGGTKSSPLRVLTSNDGVGSGERSLQILHARASDRFRTNVTIAEISGASATVRMTVVAPGMKVATSTSVSLAANEQKELSSILSQFGLSNVPNARIALEVVSGSGKITGFGTLVDTLSSEEALLPAE